MYWKLDGCLCTFVYGSRGEEGRSMNNEFDSNDSFFIEEVPDLENQRGSGTQTYFVFLDLPQHLEILAGYLPLMDEGTEVEFDLSIRNPKNPSLTKKILGFYYIDRRVLNWKNSSKRKSGLIQYIEWKKKVD